MSTTINRPETDAAPTQSDETAHLADVIAASTAAEAERARGAWTMIAIGLTGLVAILALAISVVSLASNAGTSTVVRRTAAPAVPTAAIAPLSVTMRMKPDSKVGPDGDRHDAFLPSTNMTVRPGQTVRLTVYNYDDAPHTFTSPKLAAGAAIPAAMHQMQGATADLKVMPAPGIGVDQTLPGAKGGTPSKTTFSFKAPAQAGTYFWYCKLPCDPFSMSHVGYMEGHITVRA